MKESLLRFYVGAISVSFTLLVALATLFSFPDLSLAQKSPKPGGGGAMRGGGGGVRGGGGIRGGGGGMAKPPSFNRSGGAKIPRMNSGISGSSRAPMKPPSYSPSPSQTLKVPRSSGGGHGGGGNWGGGGRGDGHHDGGRHRRHHDHDDDHFYFSLGYWPWYGGSYGGYGYDYYNYYPYYYPSSYYAYPEVVTVPVYPQVVVPEPNYYPPGLYYPETKYYEPGPESANAPTQGIGWDFLRSGQPEQALSAFKTEAGDNPGQGIPLIGQALSYLELEHPIDASKFFIHALQMDPNAFAQIRLEDSMRSKLENRVATISGNPTPNLESDTLDLACLHYLLGRPDAARAEAERAKSYERNAPAVGNLMLLIDAMSRPQTGAPG